MAISLFHQEPKAPLTKGRVAGAVLFWLVTGALELSQHRVTLVGRAWHIVVVSFSMLWIGLGLTAWSRLARGKATRERI